MNIADHRLNEQGNPIFLRNGLEVEVEYRSCACEIKFPVLRADGNIYLGWSDILWAIHK